MLFSIVMPVFLVSDYIEESIRSIVYQTEKDFELIIIDDGGDDDSIYKAKCILEKTNVRYKILSQNNSGVSSARNVGLKQAVGKWVICIDPDDCIHPQTLERVKKVIASCPEIEIIAFNYRMFSNQYYDYGQIDGMVNYTKYKNSDAANSYLDRNLKLITPGMLIRRDILEEKGLYYRQEVIYSEDTLYIWKVLFSVKEIAYIHEFLYYYLIRPNSTMTSSDKNKILNGFQAYKKFDEELNNIIMFPNQKFIFPRWIMGVMHSSSKYMSYKEYRNLLSVIDFKNNIAILCDYHNGWVRMIARMISVLGSLSYFILRMA